MSTVKITTTNFEQEVLQSQIPVLLDFWADWCGPCMMLSPIISEIAEEHPEIKVGKVNVDEQPELSMAFKVENIPLVVLVKDGVIHKKSVGYVPKNQILDMLK